jgi:hypothetical protein
MRSLYWKVILSLVVLVSPLVAQQGWPTDQEANQLVPGKEVPTSPCRATPPLLTTDSLGPLRPGMTLRQILTACPSAYYGWHWEEGIPEPALAIRLGSSIVLAALTDTAGPKAAVYRILLADSTIKTREGIGPNSQIKDMIASWGTPRMGVAECSLYVWFDARPHISWITYFPQGWDCDRLERFVADSSATHLPRDLRVGLGILAK